MTIKDQKKIEQDIFYFIKVGHLKKYLTQYTQLEGIITGGFKILEPPPQSPKVRPKHRQTIYFWKACKISRFEFMFIFFSRPLGRGSGAKCVFSPLISALQRGLILKTIA